MSLRRDLIRLAHAHPDLRQAILGILVPEGSPRQAAQGEAPTLARFEEGESADPTENMSPEDAKKWRDSHEEHKDNFKNAAGNPGPTKRVGGWIIRYVNPTCVNVDHPDHSDSGILVNGRLEWDYPYHIPEDVQQEALAFLKSHRGKSRSTSRNPIIFNIGVHDGDWIILREGSSIWGSQLGWRFHIPDFGRWLARAINSTVNARNFQTGAPKFEVDIPHTVIKQIQGVFSDPTLQARVAFQPQTLKWKVNLIPNYGDNQDMFKSGHTGRSRQACSGGVCVCGGSCGCGGKGGEAPTLARFEEGKSADPTENMSPEDAKKWRDSHEEHKDNFKAATSKQAARSIHEIANEIRRDWGRVHFSAAPYLQAMATLDKITDQYGTESAAGIILHFLSNAASWKGDVAKRIKAELKTLTKGKFGASPRTLRLTGQIRTKNGRVLPAGTEIKVEWTDKPSLVHITPLGETTPIKVNTIYLGKYVDAFQNPPLPRVLSKWLEQGEAETPSGQKCEPDGYGRDGSPSWLLVVGMV